MEKKHKILLKLFISTFYLSAFTFGGGYVIVTLMKKKFVDQYHWIEEEEMLDLVAIAQSAPGAIAVNGAIVVGYKLAGIAGTITAVIATILPPFLVISVISIFYEAFRDNQVVSLVLEGMQAGVAAVIASVVWEMAAGILLEKKWLSILVSSHIIALIQPYHNNALKRVVKMPLIHFLDTGLASYLLRWGNPEALERGAMSGAFFESYVFSEIYKSYLNAGKEPPIFYYRDKDQKEIDLLLYQNGILSPIEIKKSASPGKAAIKNFKVLEPVSRESAFGGLESLKVEIGTGSVVCMANDLLPVDEKNWYVPVWLI